MPVGEDRFAEEKGLVLDLAEDAAARAAAEGPARGRKEKEADGGQAGQTQGHGRPDEGDPPGHVQAAERGDEGEEEEDDDPGHPLDDDDGRGFDNRGRVFRPVPDADDVAPEAGREEGVEEFPDEVGLGQEAEGDDVALGPGQDLPAVGAEKQAEGVEGEGEGQEKPVRAPKSPADFGELRPGQDEDGGQAAQAEGQAEQEGEGFSAHRLVLPQAAAGTEGGPRL